MADELKLKIVLDDGSVKDGFLSIEKSADKSAKTIESNFLGLSDEITSSIKGIGIAFAGVFAASKVVGYLKESAKAAIEAENANNALGSSLAQIGKYSASALDGFSKYASNLQATTGIEDDLIKQNAALLVSIGKLTGAGLERGTKAALDLSRALQIDTGTAFDLVSKAASGSTGALSRYGIKIDENIPKAQKWSEALKLIETRFGGLAETRLNTLEGSLTNLNNSFGEIKESIGGIFTNSVSLRAAINFVATSFFQLSDSIAGAVKGKDVLKDLLSVLVQIAAVVNNFILAPLELFVRGLVFGFQTLKLALDTLVVGIVGFSKLLVEAVVIPIEGLVSGIGKLASVVDKDLGQSLQNSAKSFREFFTKPLEEELAKVSGIQENTFNSLAANADSVFSFKLTDSVNTWLVGFKDAMEQAKQSTGEFKNAVTSIEQPLSSISGLFGAFVDGFKAKSLEFSVEAKKNFQEVGKTAFTTLGTGIGGAFAKFGQALANGEDAGKAFLDSMIGVFADIAIQLGTSFILQGIAYSLNPATPGMGGPLIGAGAALATFGGVLKAISGGKSSTSQSSVSEGGGIAATPSPSTELTPTQNLTRQEPGTSVSVVIQGDVLDSDESGSRIVSLINSAFDKKGVVISQGAFA